MARAGGLAQRYHDGRIWLSCSSALRLHPYCLPLSSRIILSTVVIALIVGEWSISAHALTLQYRCRATPDAVFQIASKTVQEMDRWPWVKIIESERTIKTFVRNWRNFGIPVWIQVYALEDKTDSPRTELDIQWEQTLDPLNYPDLFDFLEVFDDGQRKKKLGCRRSGTDIGL